MDWRFRFRILRAGSIPGGFSKVWRFELEIKVFSILVIMIRQVTDSLLHSATLQFLGYKVVMVRFSSA